MRTDIVGIFAVASIVIAGSVSAIEMPELARKNSCVACHSIDKRIVGPSWMDVSKRYKGATKFTYNGKEYDLEEGLIIKVSKGGSGNWGSMPMPANVPAVKIEEVKELVHFILGLAK